MKKTLITLFLLLMLADARADNYSGSCGDNVFFTYNVTTHSLRIFGSGKMSENYYKNMPWDSYKADIQTVSIETGVTYIGRYAFENCSNISKASISNTVASIGMSAFARCTSLASIDIPNSLTTIGDNAFQGCQSVTSLVIHKNLTNIGVGAFRGCSGLSSIVVEDGNVKYDSRDNCNAIIVKNTNSLLFGCKSTIIPNSVTNIADGAFSECSELISVNIPSSIISIGNSAFYGCSKLISISLPSSVSSLGTFTFSRCSNLKTVDISCRISTINKGTFSYCVSLSSVNIPNSVSTIGQEAFDHCSNLISVIIPSSVTIISNGAFSGCGLEAISIPNNVSYIGEYAFAFCNNLLEIILPNSITLIGRGTFSGCTSLQSVKIPDSVVSIGETAFNSCKSLKEIVIPSGVFSIGDNAFSACGKLRSVTIPNSVKTVGVGAFAWCDSLASIVIPDGVTAIQDGTFSRCGKLATISIPNSITSIGDGAFEGCVSLSSFKTPECLTNVGNRAFYDCSSLTEFVVPSSVRSIGNEAFYSCEALNSIDIPDNVVFIGESAFNGCSSLASASIGNGITSIRKSTFTACGLQSVTIGENVDSICDFSFQFCSKLSSITIPNNVKRLGDSSFYGCKNVTSLRIGNGITEIEECAFLGCTSLKDVYCHTQGIPYTSQDAFYYTPIENATLHVPALYVPSFKTHAPWSGFKQVVALEDEIPEQPTNECDNMLKALDIEALTNTQVNLSIELTNEDEVKLCQFDLRLPDGVTVATKSNGKLDAKLTERAENHSVSATRLTNGDYRFVVSSLDNDSFVGNEGTLMEITLDIAETMEAGEYTVKVLNTELSVPDGNDLMVVRPKDTESKLTVKSYTPGDVNNDGSVSVTDVGCAINYILEQVPSVFVFEAADMNGDKTVSVTDVGMIINLILSEGAARRERNDMEGNLNNENNVLSGMSLIQTTGGYEMLLENKDDFIAFQFDVEVAGGATVSDVKVIGDSDHMLSYRQLENGRWRVVCYSPTNSTFATNGTELLSVNAKDGITISNIRLTTAGYEEWRPADISATPTGIASMKQDLQMSVQSGLLYINSDREVTLQVYSLDGRICRTLNVSRGQNAFDGLPKGIYMINNKKIILR